MVCDIVTGATGFVGQALVLRWLNLASNTDKQLFIVGRSRPGYLKEGSEFAQRCHYLEFDFTKSPRLSFPSNVEVDTIYHCGGLASISAKRQEALKTNVQGTVDFLNWVGQAAKTKIKRVIFISSTLACGYDTSGNGNFCRLETKAASSANTPYGRSKYLAELELKRLARKLDFHLIIIRPAYIFGPQMRPNSGFVKFIRMVENQGIGVRFNYPGSLSYTFIDNFVSLLLQQSKDRLPVEEYFFADGPPILYRDLFRLLGDLTAKEVKPLRLPSILYRFFSGSLIYLSKVPYIKEMIPIYFLPLLRANVGCINFAQIKARDKGCITVSLEEGLKRTIGSLKG